MTGIERWKEVADQLGKAGGSRKPMLFNLCADKGEAREVANLLSYGQASLWKEQPDELKELPASDQFRDVLPIYVRGGVLAELVEVLG